MQAIAGRLQQGTTSRRAESGSGQAIDAKFVLGAMRRWWKFALPAGLVLAACAIAAIYCMFEPQYEASALLEIRESPQYIAFETRGGVSSSFFHTQVNLIRSRWVMDHVLLEKIGQLAEIRKQADPVAWLIKQVGVAPVPGSSLLQIKYAGPDPNNAALVANEVAGRYLKRQEEEESKGTEDIRKALSDEKSVWDKQVRELKKLVETQTQDVSGREPELARPDPNSPAHNPLSDLQGKLITVQVEHVMLAARIKACEQELHEAEAAEVVQSKTKQKADAPLTKEELKIRDELVHKTIEQNPDVLHLKSVILAQRTRLPSLAAALKRGKQDKMYLDALKEIDSNEHSLEELKKSLVAPTEEDATATVRAKRNEGGITTVATLRETLKQLQEEAEGYRLGEVQLREAYYAKLAVFLKDFKELSGQRLNLTFMKDELAQKQNVLERITERLIVLQTEQKAPPRVVSRVEASAPAVPVEVLPYKRMGLAGLASFCFPFVLAVAWEAMTRRISSPEDLQQQLHLAVLGEITRLPTRNRVASRTSEASIGLDLRIFQESIDSLRTALTLSSSSDLRDMRILAITSASNSEGKTSVATQLALSLARATGKTVLLIDGDMRSPDVHKVFGVPLEPGLAEVLGDKCPLAKAIVAARNEHVHLLPAGRLKVSPHRLLGNGSWKSLLTQIPSGYGYVIIDTPPVLAASESLVLAQAADATLLCVMRDVSRADQVRLAAARLERSGGHPVGTVLSGIPTKHYTYGYGTYPAQTKHS
jgi:capsular exopolysaccharide synthesis family protein